MMNTAIPRLSFMRKAVAWVANIENGRIIDLYGAIWEGCENRHFTICVVYDFISIADGKNNL